MQHNGVEFQVVQTASPTGWKWTVQIPGKKVMTGRAVSRALAIAYAKTAIDRVMKAKPQPEQPTQ
jgi:hypothetical protein